MTFGIQLACSIQLFLFRAEHLQYSLGTLGIFLRKLFIENGRIEPRVHWFCEPFADHLYFLMGYSLGATAEPICRSTEMSLWPAVGVGSGMKVDC